MTKLMKQGETRKSGVGDRPNHRGSIIVAKDMTDLWEKANDAIIWGRSEDLSYWSSLDSMISDCVGMADSGEYELDIGRDLWLTPTRWSTLCNQYVNPERLFDWLEKIKDVSTYNRGIVAMDMNPVAHTVVKSNIRASRRKHGGCMRMITYRAYPQPTVTLFSRTSYLGYIGGLDLLLAHKLIEQACDMIGDGLHPSQFQFRWVCDTWQFHGFKSLAYLFATGQDKFMRLSDKAWARHVGDEFNIHGVRRTMLPLEEMPTWRLIRYWWARIAKQDREGKLYEDMKYGAEKRIRRRYHAHAGVDQTPYLGNEREYKPLSTPIELVTLDKMIYSTPESRAKVRKQKVEKVKALVERLSEDDSWLGLDSIELNI